MKTDIRRKLWVIKFCLKLIYPKYNFYMFFTFLAVKYRLCYYRKNKFLDKMDSFVFKTNSSLIQKKTVKSHTDGNSEIVWHKCLVISRDQFIELATENLFYLDNGLLWAALKLCPSIKKKLKDKKNNDKLLKYNLNFMTSEVQKNLRLCSFNEGADKVRIVPIIGSKHVEENVVVATESENANVLSSFNVQDLEEVKVTFHPVPTLQCAPKIASSAEVSLIANDYDLSNEFLKEVLNNYFEAPKLAHVNDIFDVELTPEVTLKHHYKYLDIVEAMGRLHFRCDKMNFTENESDMLQQDPKIQYDLPFFIVKGVTQLTLGENTHALKAKDEYFDTKHGTEGIKACPLGIKHVFDQIQETIAPFLSGDLNDLTSSLSSPILPMLLLTGALGSGRHLLVKTLAKYNGMNCLQIDCNALQSSTAKQTESKISATIQKAKSSAPVIMLLDNFEVFGVDAENNEDCRVIEYFLNSLTDLYQNYTKHSIIFIAISERSDLKPNILRLFLERYHVSKLNVEQRYEMLSWFFNVMNLKIPSLDNSNEMASQSYIQETLKRVAAKTETFLYGDIDTLIHFVLRQSYLKQVNNFDGASEDPEMHLVQEGDFNSALESMRSLQSQHLDAPKIPKVQWEDIGGLDKLKKELLKTIEFPIKYPHLFKNSTLKRSGILLYGPPGCGKTLVAKAVSTELNVSFLSVKGPELLNMYIGQSEENVRKVFESARASAPCIVFLDELDALAARRGAAGDSGGAADRVLSQLLAELDGVNAIDDGNSTPFVFTMGATNRPDLLEQSLLRPGRLDKLVYVGPYCGLHEKTRVLTALCRSHKLDADVDLTAVADALPPRCTGADLLQVVDTARAAALRSVVAKLQAGAIKESDLSPDCVVITASDMVEGITQFRPSVTPEELAYYEAMQHQI